MSFSHVFLNLKNFFNTISNNNKIYTAEDIGKMSAEEFMTNEKAIDYQMENLGIPRESDLSGNPDVVYVHAYTRDDGTEVRAHYRSKPDGVGGNNYEHSGTSTGAAEDIEPTLKLDGGITYNNYPINKNAGIRNYFERNINSTDGLLNEKTLNLLINAGGYPLNQNDAVALWNMASDSTGIYNHDYIRKNGTLYNDVDSLTSEYAPYKTKIKNKIKSQFGDVNVPGVVLHENSNVSNVIAHSEELESFIRNNYADLKSGKEVSGSFRFNGFTNLHNAFGSVDVLSAKVRGNYVDVTLLDTYDFNKNDSNLLVKMGRQAQETGKLNPYFTIVRCRYKMK